MGISERYGPIHTLHLGPRGVVMLWDYQAVKEALPDQAEEFSGRGEQAAFSWLFEGYGASFRDGERAKQLRRFSITTLRNFGVGKRGIEERILEETHFLLEALRGTKGLPFDPTYFLSRTVSNVISSVVFGDRFDYEDKEFPSLLSMCHGVWGSPGPAPPVQAFTETLSQPGMPERIHEEIDRVIGRNRAPSMEDRIWMPYTNAVIHEFQRFCDVIPMGLARRVTRDTQFQGYTLPKGTEVYPVLGSVLYDPPQFSSPNTFDPSHFLDGNGQFKKSDAFVPFSIGKRYCFGEMLAIMELFLFLTSILQNFRFRSPIEPKDIDISPNCRVRRPAPQLRDLPGPALAAPRKQTGLLGAAWGTEGKGETWGCQGPEPPGTAAGLLLD
ncbi:unnamed protein product [Eretmochelys imbricata]